MLIFSFKMFIKHLKIIKMYIKNLTPSDNSPKLKEVPSEDLNAVIAHSKNPTIIDNGDEH